MQPDLAAATEKVLRLRRATVSGAASETLLAQIEDVLSEGYAEALAGDAWSLRMEERMQELIDDAVAEERVALRAIASEHLRFQRALIALRGELAGLRGDRDRLCAGSPATSR